MGVVGYSDGFVTVDGNRVVLFCGEIHYFRVPKELWLDRLLKARRAGLNCIASYIPWNWHEPIEGMAIFDDRLPPSPYESMAFSRDLEGYIALIKQLGMYFIARPGPYICSEWDGGGHPGWLYAKVSMLRSMDEGYIGYSERWYSTVLPIIERFIYSKGGPAILLQIENEYFWGDVPYHMKLYEIARRRVRDIPIITNENWYVEGTPIINTIDDYPSPWSIEGFDSKVRKYIGTQPGMPKIFMELEGGWFSTFGSPLPTNRGSFPAQWTETLIKSALGMGINGISIYMFHGGTNPGYYTGKYITTTYDYEAAIREWGELSQRYYAIKRVALFARTFQNILTGTKYVEGLIRVSKGVDVFARVGESGEAMVVLRNLAETPQFTKISYAGASYPLLNTVRVPPRNSKIVLLGYQLSGTPFKILYTSSEPLLMETVGNETVVIVYGDVFEVGEVGVEADGSIEVEFTEGVTVSKIDGGRVVISYVHGNSDRMAVLRSGTNRLYIIAVSRFRAGRTWYIDEVEPPLILVSNVYFVGRTVKSGGKILMDLELDEASYGDATLILFKQPTGIVIGGRERSLKHVYGPVYRVYIDGRMDGEKPSIAVDRVWRISKEPIQQDGGAVDPRKPLEELGALFNGYAVYSIEFSIDRGVMDSLRDKKIYISYFNDFITATLNGEPLASGYHSIEADAEKVLREGVNRLDIILESTGHPNDGLVYVPNGIVGGIYIGKIGEEALVGWRYIRYSPPYGREFSMSRFIHSPEEVGCILSNAEMLKTAEDVEAIASGGIYIKSIYVDKKVGRYILDLGRVVFTNYYPRALLFVNKKFVGVYMGPVDITDYIESGENEIAIAVERIQTAIPTIKRYQYVVEGLWRAKIHTKGLVEGWYGEGYDDSGWEALELPLYFENSAGRLVWLRGKVHIDLGKGFEAPMKIAIRASGIRALIYFNSQFIGRYVDEGPQTEFYVPEPLIKRGENTIAIMLHIVSDQAYINTITVEPWYTHRKSYIELS